MKSRALVCAIAAASLGFGSLSYAQPGHGHGRDRGSGHGPGVHAQQHRGGPPHRADHRNHRNPRIDHRADHYHYGARGPEWRRGGHVPPQYRTRHYVVNDWRAHRLSAPPRGHQWVQVGGDYVLMAIATGVIVNLLLAQ